MVEFGFVPIDPDEYVAGLRHRGDAIRQLIENRGHQMLVGRGVVELLTPNFSYASLPKQLREYLLNRVSRNGSLLDVGCGIGEWLLGVGGVPVVDERYPNDALRARARRHFAQTRSWLDKELPGLRDKLSNLHGMDLVKHPILPGIDRLEDASLVGRKGLFIQGSIYENLHRRIGTEATYDVVTSSALMHHLQDPWLAVMHMVRQVKVGGMLAVSCLPRVSRGRGYLRESLEDEWGRWRHGEAPFLEAECDYETENVQVAQLRSVDGRLISSAQFWEGFNQNNPQLQVVYSTNTVGRGSVMFGGRVAMERSDVQLHLPHLFYGKHVLDRVPSVIVAQSDRQVRDLERKGFCSMGEVLESMSTK